TSSSASGGGVLSSGGASSSFIVTSSTFSGNSAPLYSNVVFGAANMSFANTIVSNPLGGGANCNPPPAGFHSLGFNLESATACGSDQATDKPSPNPMLGGLGGNGGPTETMELMPGSPAIEAGHSSAGETADQRGQLRPSDDLAVATAAGSDGSDIGAF